jgi:hypothetical protein
LYLVSFPINIILYAMQNCCEINSYVSGQVFNYTSNTWQGKQQLMPQWLNPCHVNKENRTIDGATMT